MRSHIEVAIAATLALNLPLYCLFTLNDFDGSPNPLTRDELLSLILVAGCYLSVPFLIGKFRKRHVVRVVPVWLWVSVGGAALIVASQYCLVILLTGRRMELETAAHEWFGLSLFTLPATALVHHSRQMVGLIKRWHKDDSITLNILRRR